MAASVSEVARFEPVDLTSGQDVASGGNGWNFRDWNFREVLRMDHLDLRNQRGNDICVQARHFVQDRSMRAGLHRGRRCIGEPRGTPGEALSFASLSQLRG